MQENLLVSVIVITYNSAKFVLETLESAKAQTYKNIELIVSDDASTDDTVEICRKWLKENKEWFVRTELITVPENTGIPANCNRGLRAANGDWIKYIAGDDALVLSCVQDNVDFISRNLNEISVLFSIKRQYNEVFNKECFLRIVPAKFPSSFTAPGITAENQYKQLLFKDRIGFTATSFIRRDVLINVGLFDERFKHIEDYPMWLKLTKSGQRLYFMEQETVLHRKHKDNVRNFTRRVLVNPSFIRNEELRIAYVYPYLPKIFYFDIKWRYNVSKLLMALFCNNNNFITRQIAKLLLKYMNPFFWSIKIIEILPITRPLNTLRNI